MAAQALEVLVGRVGLHVRAQVGAVRERFPAVGAPIGFLAGVRAQVTLQEPRAREQLAAHPAHVRQLVCEHVHGERRHGHVSLAAFPAPLCRHGIQASVRLLMSWQVGRGRVGLPTFAARIFWFRLRLLSAFDWCACEVSAFRATIRDKERVVGIGDGFLGFLWRRLGRGWRGWLGRLRWWLGRRRFGSRWGGEVDCVLAKV